MGFLGRMFGGRKQTAPAPPKQSPEEIEAEKQEYIDAAAAVECPHTSLGPHWANAAEMGQHDKITGYVCGGCMRMFTVEERDALLETEAARLAWMKEQPPEDEPQPTGPKEGSPPGV